MPYLNYVPENVGISAVYARDPEVWDPFLAFTHALMRGPSPLSYGQRELIAAYVSAVNGCAYCFGAHGAAAEAFGVPVSVIETAATDLDAAALADEDRELLRFLRKVVQDAPRIVQEDVDRVRAAGWSETALNHAIGIATRYAMVNMMAQAHGIVVDAEDLKEAGRRMADPRWSAAPKRG